jgi:predicted permease
LDEVAMNGTVLGVAVGLSVVTVLLAGGIPAWRVVRRRWTGLARGSVADIPSVRGQNALVVGQLALAVVLTVGAGLMFRSLGAYTTIDTGFTAEDALTLKVALPGGIYSSPDAASGFHAEALRRISETPGVLRAAGARILPLASQIGDWGVRIEGYAAPPDFPTNGDWQYATPGYFEAMGIPLVRGRTFEAGDDAAAAGALVVNEAFVRHFWPEGDVDPIGRRVQLGGGGDVPFMTIVGVVGDVTHNGLTAEIKRKFYVPVAQWGIATTNAPNTLRYVVTTAGDPMALLEPVRAIIRDLDPTLAVAEVRTLDQIRGSAVAQPRFVAAVSAIFAGIALLLSLVGIYGVVSYGVSQRVREFGVRMALGAEQGRVISLTLRRHVPTVAFGLTLGFALSFALTRYVESLLFGVGPFDPLTYAAVVTTFLGVATMGALMPAIRASRVDPARVLREE